MDAFSKEAGLTLLLEYNTERSVNTAGTYSKQGLEDQIRKNLLDMRVLTDNKKSSATVFIHTIAQYKGSGPGSYVMTAMKKMVGTDAYLDLPDETKQCQQEVFETCVQKHLVTQAKERCGCLPWTMESHRKYEVSPIRLSHLIGNSVRFRWRNVTGECRQFIHTFTAEALTLPLGDMCVLTLY